MSTEKTKCVQCGVLNPSDTAVCISCGHDKLILIEEVDRDQTANVEKMGFFAKAGQGFWPTITSKATARKAIKQGFVAAVFVAVVSGGGGALAYADINILTISPLAMIDGLIFAIIAFGIYKNSRVASTAGLLMYIFERVDMWLTYGSRNPVMALIFILCFVNSMRGTFAYQKYSTKKL